MIYGKKLFYLFFFFFYKTFQMKIQKFIIQIINMPALLYNINRNFFKNGFMQNMNSIENNRDLY